ncbi:efflux RND transporter periplasmic adaptor subunit [Flavilitoribacter nigricans]|uniref:Efflux transporter periplasmic adaptor subunit n=1 Tax=Flavilitoribacter nigricans (strain ATCC 23147 / DSM 23189 / NBRC 102662 / NCIMB 1420 / SS-2) TaxID=1122177 RepID=A0A2D0NCJ0_FLAN2|nr:efflux RND transporter periplasmic adaptor subunit [Flavilitoribacter nigricans]PHN06090.1 efflux transporter periplasmic adaptor subunit [Flavilitoribacter nigricans DSM 23189 = NBRC 102662]
MQQNNKNSLIAIFPLLLLLACGEPPAHEHTEPGDAVETADHEEGGHAADEVALTEAQIKTIGLTLGTFDSIKISGFIKANGTMDLPPDEVATVTAPARGFVRSTRGEYLIGSYVKKGTALATLEHPDFITAQQRYLEVSAQIEFQELEVDRQQTLQAGQAGALRALQQAESELKQLRAQLAGLSGQLAYLGINPDRVREKGIVPTVTIAAPISGYITALNINQGRFLQPEEMLYEIVDNRHIHLELDVFEKDIAGVKEKMRLSFTVPSLGNEVFAGEIRLVGRSFNMENKTVRVHGHIEGKHPAFIRGLYVEAKIWNDDETVAALPASAIVTAAGLSYIFVQEPDGEPGSSHFRRIPVRTGPSDGQFVTVTPLEALPDQPAIVRSQAYFLAAQMVQGELAHEH